MNMTVTVLNHSGLWHEYDRDCFKIVYLISMTVTALRKSGYWTMVWPLRQSDHQKTKKTLKNKKAQQQQQQQWLF